MGRPLPLRPDYDAPAPRGLARRSRDAAQTRRLLAPAAIHDGASRAEAARIGGVTLRVARDWVPRFDAEGPEGLVGRKAPGQPPRPTDAHRSALAAAVEDGPTPAMRGVVRWRLADLGQWLWEEFRVSVSRQTPSRELRAMGFRKLSARPRRHARAEAAVGLLEGPSRPCRRRSRARGVSARAT